MNTIIEKSNIILVETHTTNINSVITDISKILGVNIGTIKVQKWFQDYSAFVYDIQTGGLLFYKSRHVGYWESDPNILEYKK